MNDFKFAFRQLLKNPVFSLVGISVLAMGMMANTAVFGLVDAALYRPLGGVREPDQLVGLEVPSMDAKFSLNSLKLLREATAAFQGFAAYDRRSALFFSDKAQTRLQTEFVSGNFFSLLGVKPFLGRLLDETDQSVPQVVISHRLWRTRFDADPDILGRKMEVNSEPFTIVGVAAKQFGGMQAMAPVSAWLSCKLSAPHLPDRIGEATSGWLSTFGRLKPNVTLAAARDSLLPLQSQVLEPWMLQNNRSLQLTPCGRGALPGNDDRSMASMISMFLYTVVVLVLAVSCANLASLLLSRGLNRRREIAIRMALGSSRWRLIRHLLTETVVLSLLGGLVGLVLSIWGSRLATLALPQMSRAHDINLALSYDWRIIGYTLGTSLIIGVLCGLVPAWSGTRVDCQTVLKDETPGIGPKRRWFDLQSLLIVSQVSVCVVLLVGGGLLLRNLYTLQNQKVAFDYDNCVVTALWDKDAATSDAENDRLRDELLESVRLLPGVTSASLSSHPPLGVGSVGTSVSEPESGRFSQALINTVTPGYFEVLKIPLKGGRDFSSREVNQPNSVVIVNQSLAAEIWPDQNPLGRFLKYGRNDYEVVGIVADACYWNVTERKASAGIYFLEGQRPSGTGGYLIVRTSLDTGAMKGLVASLVRQADPGHEQPYVTDYADLIAVGRIFQRTTAWVLGLASGVSLILVSTGLYGVLSYHIAQRTREIGVRIALGAGRGHVLRSMLRRGLTPVGVGLLVGGTIGIFASNHLDKLFFKIAPVEPVTILIISLLIGGVALLACWLPAHHASKMDSMEAMRNQ